MKCGDFTVFWQSLRRTAKCACTNVDWWYFTLVCQFARRQLFQLFDGRIHTHTQNRTNFYNNDNNKPNNATSTTLICKPLCVPLKEIQLIFTNTYSKSEEKKNCVHVYSKTNVERRENEQEEEEERKTEKHQKKEKRRNANRKYSKRLNCVFFKCLASSS